MQISTPAIPRHLDRTYLRGLSQGRSQCVRRKDAQPAARRLRRHFLAGPKGPKAVERKILNTFQPRGFFVFKLLVSKLLYPILTLRHLSKAWRVSCNRLTTNSGDRKVSPWVSMTGPRDRLVRCLIRSFSSWMLERHTDSFAISS